MINFHTVFFFRILVPYIAGTFLGLYLFTESWQGFILVLIGIFLYIFSEFKGQFLKFKYAFLKGLGIFVIITGLGILRLHDFQEIRNPYHISKALEQKQFTYVKAKIIESSEKKSGFRVKVVVEEVKFSKHRKGFKSKGTVILYLKSDAIVLPSIGDKIVFDLNKLHEINPPKNPGEFNYKQFLSYQNIHHQAFLNENDMTVFQSKKGVHFKTSAIYLRGLIRTKLVEIFPDEEVSSFAEALLVGYKDNLHPELIDSFSKTGTLHVLAVSGLHAGIIFLILSRFLFFLENVPKGHILKGLLIIAGMWFYAFVTGLSPSVNRAALMLTCVQIGLLLHRKGNIYNTLSIAAFIMLLFNPLLIVSVSFQLSFTAVIGIVYFQPKIKNLFEAPNKFVKYFWELTAVSLAAQLATFPLGLFYFNQFPTYFLFSNLFIIPLIFITLVLLISTVSLIWIPIVCTVLTFLSTCSIKLIIWLVVNIKNLPSSSIDRLYISPLEIGLIYVIILCLSWLLIYKNKAFFYFSLMLILSLSISFTHRLHENRRQYFVIAHAINKQKQAVSVLKGKHALILCNNAFYEDEEAQKFYLKPLLAKHGISEIKMLNMSDNSNLSNYDSHTYSFFLSNDNIKITYYNNIDNIDLQSINSFLKLSTIQHYSTFE